MECDKNLKAPLLSCSTKTKTWCDQTIHSHSQNLDEKLRAIIKDSFKRYGYEFSSDQEMIDFCIKRVDVGCYWGHSIVHIDKEPVFKFYAKHVSKTEGFDMQIDSQIFVEFYK